MKECKEKIVTVGFSRDPKRIFDEVEYISAEMIRCDWTLKESYVEDGLGNIHLLFERDVY